MRPDRSLDYSRFVGIRYTDRGRSPDTGWDCYGLYRFLVGETRGVSLPSYTYSSATDKASVVAAMGGARGHFEPVLAGAEVEGDAVVFLLGGQPLHVGYVTQPGIMLHALQGCETCFERYNSLKWQKRIEGFYRWKS